MTAWEDFGLDVAKLTVIVFGLALLAGAIWGLTGRLRDWRERVMWEQAEAEAQAALDFAQVDFQAHVTQAFNIAMTGTPLYDQLAAEKFHDQIASLDVYRDEDWQHWGTDNNGGAA